MFYSAFQDCHVVYLDVFELTRPHIDHEGALGDSHPSEGDSNSVRAGLGGPVGAAVRAVALILHHHLHAVVTALWVSDQGRHVSCTGSYRDDVQRKLYSTSRS